jgi:AcrR family transcriptional regulator
MTTLRERKQRRTRDTIIESALTLFEERGFDGVTVNEIAEHAEVGRTTFFRYFADKQEVLFAEDDELLATITEAVGAAAGKVAPIGDNLRDAIGVTRAGLLAVAEVIVDRKARWLPLRERLMRENPALDARNLLKERRYLQASRDLLVQHGATNETATLSAGIAAACYLTAQATSANHPARLPANLDAAFARVATLTTP